jgi:ASC-1-like (ASCH) protein
MKGEYNFELSQNKHDSINNSNNLIRDEISIRPISANIKRPDTFKFNKTAVKVQKTEFPTLFTHLSQASSIQNELQKAKSISKNVEKVNNLFKMRKGYMTITLTLRL